MKVENVLYTDGHEVTVTESMLQVKKKWYSLSGITKHGFSIIRPDRFHQLVLVMLGGILEIVGAARLIPHRLVPDVIVFDRIITANQITILAGTVLLLIGGGLILFIQERYALSITTAEGERNVVVSRRKEYIAQIVHALNDAFFAKVTSGNGGTKSRKKEFQVSSR